MLCTFYTTSYTLHTANYSLYSALVHCIKETLHFTLYTVWTLYITQQIAHYTLPIKNLTQQNVHCKLHAWHSTPLYTALKEILFKKYWPRTFLVLLTYEYFSEKRDVPAESEIWMSQSGNNLAYRKEIIWRSCSAVVNGLTLNRKVLKNGWPNGLEILWQFLAPSTTALQEGDYQK